MGGREREREFVETSEEPGGGAGPESGPLRGPNGSESMGRGREHGGRGEEEGEGGGMNASVEKIS